VLRIGTRGSALALWQARTVAASIESRGVPVEIVTITTHGDRRQDAPLTAIGGKGVFVKEIHEALLDGAIDLAVHSAKDMAAVSPAGLTIGAVLPREDPRDALILPSRREAVEEASLEMRVIGTGSPRRVAQLRRIHPDTRFESIRGNVDTRLRKLDAGEVDALVLACAGLRRLGLQARITRPIPIAECVPAPGQGIIAVEIRASDERTRAIVSTMDDAAARAALAAEQAVVEAIGGGCQLPLGAFAELKSDGGLSVRAIAASPAGGRVVEAAVHGSARDAREAGLRLGRELASLGAGELLQS
jgi:hydroxymethylbilane synthase